MIASAMSKFGISQRRLRRTSSAELTERARAGPEYQKRTYRSISGLVLALERHDLLSEDGRLPVARHLAVIARSFA